MAIYAIADLHLSFSQDKPMDIFGYNWENHAEKIKNKWMQKVKDDDYVILAGDFSWAMHLKDTYFDFAFLNNLPGYKILLKGNHDYWWTTLKSMRNFFMENDFKKIDFLHNNSYCIEDKIIIGTRGWNISDVEQDKKMINRENERLKLSIKDAIEKYGSDKEKIVFFHYPPVTKSSIKHGESEFVQTLHEYGIKKCYYGHLHGDSHNEAVIGKIKDIEYYLISADYLDFDLVVI